MPVTTHRWGGPSDDYDWPAAVALMLPADVATVPEVRSTIHWFLLDIGLAQEARQAVELAATEAVSNAVQHAYTSWEIGEIEVVADYEADSVEVVVRDSGGGLRPGRSADHLGVGLPLIAELADDFSISARDDGGIEVWMRFVCA